ncbi:MAG TPA: TPM domain-containing protein [Edaphobacter sp.]
MKCISRWLAVIVLVLAPVGFLSAERVSTLPAPTGFVNDFAGVLSPSVRQSVEDLCIQVDRQAHAQIAVVTVKTIDDDMSIEEFATALGDKWKVGAKGTDRGVLLLVSLSPRKYRIEVGYGLEGILNDAKVGDIGRAMVPALSQNDYNTAIPLGVRMIARVIAIDAGVTLTEPVHQYHRQVQQQPVHLSLTQIVLGGAAILLVLFFLVKTGNIGLIFFLLANIMGGGRGGGGGGRNRDGDGGGGFGGFGGGSSGGGGASGDY